MNYIRTFLCMLALCLSIEAYTQYVDITLDELLIEFDHDTDQNGVMDQNEYKAVKKIPTWRNHQVKDVDNFYKLKNLESFILMANDNIKSIDFGKFKNLEVVALEACKNLEEVNIKKLKKLRVLNISYCNEEMILSYDAKSLKNVERFTLNAYKKHNIDFSKLRSVEEFTMNSTPIENVDLSGTTFLKHVHIFACSALQYVEFGKNKDVNYIRIGSSDIRMLDLTMLNSLGEFGFGCREEVLIYVNEAFSERFKKIMNKGVVENCRKHILVVSR